MSATAPLFPFERIARADAVTWLRTLPSDSVDLVVTDHAYESLEKHRAKGTTTRLKLSKASSNEWFPIFPNARLPELFAEFYRVLKPNTHCYLFSDQETMFVAKPLGEQAGFKFWKAIIWDKGPGLGMGYHYRSQHELVLFFEKGKRRLNDLGIPDIIRERPIRSGYPTEKPPRVAKVLIEQSTEPGGLVIDPFMGSGSTWHAATLAGRSFAGCDIEQRAIDFATKRIGSLSVPAEVGAPAVEEEQLALEGEGASSAARAQGGSDG